MAEYYTPEISEFHVGFEYYFCPAYQEGVSFTDVMIDGIEGYEPKIFNFDIWNYCSNPKESWKEVFESMISYNQVKVKYLDKADIESLGFEYKTDFGDSTDNLLFSFIKNGIGLYRLYFNKGKNKVTITHRFSVGQTIFEGYIKNKSELKRLLKQLGVDE